MGHTLIPNLLSQGFGKRWRPWSRSGKKRVSRDTVDTYLLQQLPPKRMDFLVCNFSLGVDFGVVCSFAFFVWSYLVIFQFISWTEQTKLAGFAQHWDSRNLMSETSKLRICGAEFAIYDLWVWSVGVSQKWPSAVFFNEKYESPSLGVGRVAEFWNSHMLHLKCLSSFWEVVETKKDMRSHSEFQ